MQDRSITIKLLYYIYILFAHPYINLSIEEITNVIVFINETKIIGVRMQGRRDRKNNTDTS